MDWRSSLKRSQSLRTVTHDQPAWTDVGLQDKSVSVSRLVARYQVGASQHVQTTRTISVEVKPREEPLQTWRPHLDLKDTVNGTESDEILKNDAWSEPESPTGLTRSKSLSSIPHGAGAIHLLKERFEPKAAVQSKTETVRITQRKSCIAQTPKTETEKRKKDEDEQKISVDALENEFAAKAKQSGLKTKMENDKIQRRRTIGGIDFEQMAAIQAEEKRRSIADFRDSAEKLCVSVKAISALYLSKVAPQDSKTQVRSESVKRPRLTKMAQCAKDDILQPPLDEDRSRFQERVTIEKIQQRRRKNELKRLLKHTHPEIIMLDKVVDKELAAEEAAAETGYEGEVFSKCLIFENSTMSNKESCFTTNTAEETHKNGLTPTVSEGLVTHSDPNKELVDEEVRIDIKSTRRMFEEKSMNAAQSSHCKSKERSFNEEKAPQNRSNPTMPFPPAHYDRPMIIDSTHEEPAEVSDDDFISIPEPETFGDSIKTSVDLFHHNPFITLNVEKEHLHFESATEYIPEGASPNVKNRKHLFESMPFDKIRQQNKDDLETMVAVIKETLHFLHSVDMLRSKGSIIEIHETMKATKAKFILTETGPEIQYDSVTEAGAQNLILQLLPRSNIQPQIKYLKEDSHGEVTAIAVNAPVDHPRSDQEFKTANVVQLIEDILNQDNSLRKGVLILDEVAHCAQVSVYSLYHYIDVEDVKSFCPSQQAADDESGPETRETIKIEIPQMKSGIIKSAIHCLQEAQTETAPARADITTKGNVKLFKSCIEKGDMDYLKSLQAQAEIAEEEATLITPEHNIIQPSGEASDPEYEAVDVKKLKSLFTDKPMQSELKPASFKKSPQPISWSEEKCKITSDRDEKQPCEISFTQADRCLLPFEEEEEGIHQAEVIEVLDECHEISNLQSAISQLQKATVKAKSTHDSLQDKQDVHGENQTTSVQTNTSCPPLKTNENICKESGRTTGQTLDTVANPEDEELVLDGKLQAALQALERSNLNVTQGGFEAAMLYRNSNKLSSSAKSPTLNQELGCHAALEQNVEEVCKGGANDLAPEKHKKTQRAKPALPPKPEHLKVDANKSKENKAANGLAKLENHCMEIPVTSELTKEEKIIPESAEVNVLTELQMDKEESDETHVNFHEACQIFGGKKAATKKTAPVKPKRVKIAKSDPKNQDQSHTTCATLQESDAKVNMRLKRVCKETEDERRQRLSVHMDEIMRGNMTAAMEIFDNLRKQEELENILIRVEEIEKDTSDVDVKSLRKVFEDVPDWVVGSDKKKGKVQQQKESRNVTKPNSESRTPIANVFGDLARASEEIIHLKEQTLARLMDIEEAIKKALYSVSNLKSESDIVGLSSLFKESMGGSQTANSSGNIRTISIGSSRTKVQDLGAKTKHHSGGGGSPKQPSPTSSPAYISIQSAARKTDVPPEITVCQSCQNAPKPEEKFRTTKTVQCNSPAQKGTRASKQRELSMLEVQTDSKGTKKNTGGTKTITENYERRDDFGNTVYSIKASTVVTTEPQMTMPCPVQTAVSPAFQPVSQEKCSACSRPVYPMESISTDKNIFHRACFYCKHCKKKLSMLTYASLRGELYCSFHYRQLLRTKADHDEGFGNN